MVTIYQRYLPVWLNGTAAHWLLIDFVVNLSVQQEQFGVQHMNVTVWGDTRKHERNDPELKWLVVFVRHHGFNNKVNQPEQLLGKIIFLKNINLEVFLLLLSKIELCGLF